MQLDPILDLKQFLTFLSLGGAAVAVQVVYSILADKSPWFQNLAADTKFTISLTLAIVLGLGSTLTLALTPPETLQALQPYFLSLVLSVSPLVGGELLHKILKKAPVTKVTTTSVKPASTSTTVTTDAPPAG